MCSSCGNNKKTLMINVTVFSGIMFPTGSKRVKTINKTVLFQSLNTMCGEFVST